MSLINQVLRDLDRRLGTMPQLPGTALAPTAAPIGRRVRHARHVAASGVGGVALLGVALAVAWPSGARSGAAKVDAVEAAVRSAPPAVPGPINAPLPRALAAAAATDKATATASMAATPVLIASADTPVLSAAPLPAAAPPAIRLRAAAPDVMPGAAPMTAARPAAPASASTASTASTAATPRRRAARLAPDETLAWAPAESAPVKVPQTALPRVAPLEAAVPAGAAPLLPAATDPGAPTHIEKRASGATRSERADAEYRLGVAAHERGQIVDAAKSYAAALKVDGSLAVARVGLASVLIAQNRTGEAEEVLQAGLASNPQQANLALPLARLMAARGDLNGAVDVMRAGLPGAAGRPEYRAYSGAILQRAGRHAEAAENFEAALRVAPGNGVWWMGLGISLAAEGRSDAARTAYSQARASGSLSPELLQFVDQRLRQLL